MKLVYWQILGIIIHQIFSLACDWSKRIMWLNIPQPKLGNIRWSSPNACYKKYLKDSKHNSLHLAQKYARMFVLRHYQFLGAHSYCSLLRTYNVRGQVSKHVFAPNREYCLYIDLLTTILITNFDRHVRPRVYVHVCTVCPPFIKFIPLKFQELVV